MLREQTRALAGWLVRRAVGPGSRAELPPDSQQVGDPANWILVSHGNQCVKPRC